MQEARPARAAGPFVFSGAATAGGNRSASFSHGAVARITHAVRRREKSARAAHRTRAIGRQRPGPGAEARHQRRRHIVQRRAAVGAAFLKGVIHAHPVPAGTALGIQALHGRTRQIQHGSSSHKVWGAGSKRGGERRLNPCPEPLKHSDQRRVTWRSRGEFCA